MRALAKLLRAHPLILCTVIVAVLYWPTLTSGYVMDDFIHLQVFDLPAPQRPRDHWGLVTLFDFSSGDASPGMPWWASEGIQTRFWRPLSSLLGYADHLIAPHQPLWAHVHSVAWFLASIAAFRFLLKETCDQGETPISWVALMALLIYTMTCTHAFPTLWIANRGALIATSLSWLAIGWYARGQRKPSTLADIGSSLALGAALLAGEIAWVGVIQLACFAIWGDERPWKQKLARLGPHALVVVSWTWIYLHQGYGARGGGYYLHPIADFWLFVQDAPSRLAQLSALAFAFVPMEVSQSPELQGLVVVAGALMLGLAIWCAKTILPACSPNHQRSLRWMGLAGIFGTLPILGAQPNDRLLVPIMLSTSFVFATLIRHLGQRRQKRIFLILAGLGVLRHLILAPCLTLVVNWSLANKSHAGNEANAAFASQLVQDPNDGLNIVINAVGPAIAWSFEEHLAYLRDQKDPSKGWRFAAATRSDLILTRSSSTSFELGTTDGSSLANGLFGKLLRSELDKHRDPLKVGRVIDRQDFRVEVLELDPEGQPTRVRFLFPDAEIKNARFYQWDGQRLQEIKLPELGAAQTYPWSVGPMGI